MPLIRPLTRTQRRALSDAARNSDAGPLNRFVTMADIDLALEVDAASVAATSANLASAAPNTLDGVTLTKGMRVLMNHHATPGKNGPYIVNVVGTGADGSWVRPADADQAAELYYGASYKVLQGTVHKGAIFSLTTQGAVVVDTTPLHFAKVTPPVLSGAATWKKFTIDYTYAGFKADASAVVIDLVALTGQDVVFYDGNIVVDNTITLTGIAAETIVAKLGDGVTTDGLVLATSDIKTTVGVDAAVFGAVHAEKGAHALAVTTAQKPPSATRVAGPTLKLTLTASGAKKFGNGTVTNLTRGKITVYACYAIVADGAHFA